MKKFLLKIKYTPFVCHCILLILLFLNTGYSREDSLQYRPKIGLALSGGGAKGFAHIGVLKVLEEIGMPIDCISGTSMGSVVGGLYAIGYRAADLEKIAVETNWDFVLSDRKARSVLSMEQKFFDARYNFSLDLEKWRVKLPSGLIAGQNVVRLLDRLTLPAQHIHDFSQFPIPFVCVATNIVTGKAEVLKGGSLPEAIRASMAIPSAFTPNRIDGKLLVDGMIARNFPVQDARDLGADIVIGVDVGDPLESEEGLNSFLSIMNQAVSFQMVQSTLRQRKLCDYLIVPEIGEHSASSFDEAAYFIAQGEKAAREILPQLQSLADSLRRLPAQPRNTDVVLYHALQPKDSLFITGLEVDGLNRLPFNLVRERLNIPIPGRSTLTDLEAGVDRLYGSQFFERVSYELIPDGIARRLIIRVIERSTNQFRVALRYDTKHDASLLLNTTFRNQGPSGSFLTFDVRLSSDFLLDAQYFTRTGFRRLIGLRWRMRYARQSIDQFVDDDRIARQRVSDFNAEGFLGTIFSNKFTFGGGLRLEYARVKPTIAPADFQTDTQGLLTFFGTLKWDTYNRSTFPSKGVFVNVSGEYSDRKVLSEKNFNRIFFDGRAKISLSSQMTLITCVFLGTSGGDVPFHYQYMLGGVDLPMTFLGDPTAFYGFRPYEFMGKNAQYAQLGLQYEIFPKKYIVLNGNGGNTFSQWETNFDPERYFYGGAVTFGMDTRLGPVEFTVMSSKRRNFLTYINIGFKF